MKAILVVDIPDKLKYEDLYLEGRILYTTKNDIGLKFLEELSLCSLKHLPQKKMAKHGEAFPQDMRLVERWKGYDMCIDEILGG